MKLNTIQLALHGATTLSLLALSACGGGAQDPSASATNPDAASVTTAAVSDAGSTEDFAARRIKVKSTDPVTTSPEPAPAPAPAPEPAPAPAPAPAPSEPVATPSPAAPCSTTAVQISGAGTSLSLRASRNSGAAPLMVYFDTRGTTVPSTSTAPKSPFLDLPAKWDFGDQSTTGSAPWGTGISGASRNRWTGPMAAHLYETPGAYEVNVTAADGAIAHRCSISVEDPETVWAAGATACFSGVGNFDGCPAGAQQIKAEDFGVIAAKPLATNSIRRLLLRRGETFTSLAPGIIAVQGPGLVGGFGTGADPRIVLASTIAQDTPIVRFSNSATSSGQLKDWRIVGLHFDGTGTANKGLGVTALGGIDQVSIVRNRFTALRLAVLTSDFVLAQTTHHIWDQWAFYGNRLDEIVAGTSGVSTTYPYGTYMSGERLYYAGNLIDGHGNGHNSRFPYLGMAIISNNSMSQPGPTAHHVKVHAPLWGRTDAWIGNSLGAGGSRWIDIAENQFVSSVNPWQVVVGPASPESDERVRDALVERNWHTFATATQMATVMFGVTDGSVRDNTLYASTSKYVTGTYVGRRGTTDAAKPSSGIAVEHNVSVAGSVISSPYTWATVEASSTATIGDNLAVRSGCDLTSTTTFAKALWDPYAASNTTASCAP